METIILNEKDAFTIFDAAADLYADDQRRSPIRKLSRLRQDVVKGFKQLQVKLRAKMQGLTQDEINDLLNAVMVEMTPKVRRRRLDASSAYTYWRDAKQDEPQQETVEVAIDEDDLTPQEFGCLAQDLMEFAHTQPQFNQKATLTQHEFNDLLTSYVAHVQAQSQAKLGEIKTMTGDDSTKHTNDGRTL